MKRGKEIAFFLLLIVLMALVVKDSRTDEGITGKVAINRGENLPALGELTEVREGVTVYYSYQGKNLKISDFFDCDNIHHVMASSNGFSGLTAVSGPGGSRCPSLGGIQDNLREGTLIAYDSSSDRVYIVRPEDLETKEPVRVEQAVKISQESTRDNKKLCFEKKISYAAGNVKLDKNGEFYAVFPVRKDLEDLNCLSFVTPENLPSGEYSMTWIVSYT